ncbi:MAG: hypothetical protein A2660_00320 [Candidatus Doudnabacteria bacterium RIFCSPHIGHO2_01_FULL_45_18]|uniref:HIT domain-containing protein n=1 Tax=Candidatus Doudnabacteria bacterium RIFCSPHIGHO2_01_FULL_45_18 TaxID=1817823 RepID=A0A1F5NQX6_9BACT|nr:MAG: hypothetical protein A2660_00320 [Candidatus Doudnabacteria bacterium RIFCSPHIGHO2_01_FULL_45_18]
MNKDCVFCKIIAGEIPSDKVYEDEFVLSFLDLHPVMPGHTLIMPKQHSDGFLSTDDEILRQLVPEMKKIAKAVMQVTSAHGVNISTNHGAAAGQSVFHLHFHIIPRFDKDGLKPWPHQESEPKSRKEIAEAIKKQLS